MVTSLHKGEKDAVSNPGQKSGERIVRNGLRDGIMELLDPLEKVSKRRKSYI